MNQPSSTRKKRLGEILKDAGLVSELQLNAALSEQRKWGGKLGRTLVEMGFVDEQSMVVALSRQLQLALVDLDALQVPQDVVQYLRVDIAERYGVFPVQGDKKHKTVTIASSDPTNVEQMQELEFYTGFKVSLAVATASSIDRAIRRYYYGESTVPTETTNPRSLGVSEAEFEPEQLKGAAAVSGAAVASPELVAHLKAMIDRVAELEKLLSGQTRVLRGLVELLMEKGVISRDEYLAKVRGKPE